jgi:Ca2+-binding EF-hand superfamily protein
MDDNGDAQITRDEFFSSLTLYGVDEQSCDSLFKLCDVNGDGTITLLEFTKALRKHPELIPSRSMLSLFTALDANGDGELSHDELLSCLQARITDPALLDRIMALADYDQSGTISLLEVRFRREHAHLAALHRPLGALGMLPLTGSVVYAVSDSVPARSGLSLASGFSHF